MIIIHYPRISTPVFLPGKSHGQRSLVGSRIGHNLATKPTHPRISIRTLKVRRENKLASMQSQDLITPDVSGSQVYYHPARLMSVGVPGGYWERTAELAAAVPLLPGSYVEGLSESIISQLIRKIRAFLS